jgi:hypothetical protein
MDLLQKCLDRWGNKYEYHSIYKKHRYKVNFTCQIHGIRDQSVESHISNGCYCCYRTLGSSLFIDKAKSVHGDKYIYNNINYLSSKIGVTITCKSHGDFVQIPNNHLNGHGCSKCLNYCDDLYSFIEKSNNIHRYKYNYSNVKYTDNGSKVNIECPIHGFFSQIPSSHLSGKGCSKCQYSTLSKIKTDDNKSFIEKSILTHGDKYDYTQVNYDKSNRSVIITCKIHGDFSQRPNNHIGKGYGCPKCGNKYGGVENIWLNEMNVNIRQYRIGKYVVDGFDPTSNTIYEFNGDFWHGNPKVYKSSDINPKSKISFGELYNKTLQREEYLKSKGYTIVSIWESDFKKIIINYDRGKI